MFKEQTSSVTEATGAEAFDHPVLHIETRDPTSDSSLAPATGTANGDQP